MTDLQLRVGFHEYDRMRALFDGTVKFEGIETSFESTAIVSDVFEGMIRGKYDVAELGMTYYLRTLDFDDPPFTAIPVFPNRMFRHSAIYVNTASGIEKPADLAGKVVGEFALYGHDAGVWPKGILSDNYGVTPDQCRWVVGGLDWPMRPINFVPLLHPADVEVTAVPDGKNLGGMLEAGEIDALISAHAPRCVLDNSPRVARLFPDYKQAERDYYQRTGIFPIMHTVAVRKDLIARRPDLALTLYRGFCEAKDAAIEGYVKSLVDSNINSMLPWIGQLIEEDRRLLGDDWWPYGMAANRKAVDTFLRYHFEQGLSKRWLACEDIFIPELLGT
jgi:hypothetical protein